VAAEKSPQPQGVAEGHARRPEAQPGQLEVAGRPE
jgi:hypothetical protein